MNEGAKPERALCIFLCHSSNDKHLVRDLYHRLRADGFDPWLDEEKLLPGQHWKQDIPKAVRNSDVVVVCLSQGSITKSGYVQKEIKYALDVADEQPEGTIFLIPLKLEECNIPDRLHHLQYVNLYDQRGYDRLIASLVAISVRHSNIAEFCPTPEELLKQYLQRIREETLRRYVGGEQLFRLDLYALPIRCNDHMDPSETIRFESFLDRKHRLSLLVGPPACGKTTACHRLIVKPPQCLIPVNIREILPCTSEEALRSFADRAGIDNLQILESIERNGRLLFIADGIGEKRKVARIIDSLQLLAANLPHSRFVVTCRTGDYEQSWLPNFQRWDILELNGIAQNEFLKTQPKKLRQRVSQAFRTNPELREICQNQFLFLMVVRLMAKVKGTVTIPTRVAVYESFLEEFLRRWEKCRPGERQFIVNCLKELAIDMRKSLTDRTWLAGDKIREVLRRCLRSVDDRDIEEQLDHLYHLGLIEQVNGGTRFFQETFQEFLCAKWLVDCGTLPIRFKQRTDGSTWFEDIQINDVIRSFYDEIAGFR